MLPVTVPLTSPCRVGLSRNPAWVVFDEWTPRALEAGAHPGKPIQASYARLVVNATAIVESAAAVDVLTNR